MSKLSITDLRVLELLTKYSANHNVPPTLDEIRQGIGVKWIKTIQRSIDVLEVKGLIIKEKNVSRGIRLGSQKSGIANIPIVGSAPCGNPFLAVENVEGYLKIDKSLLRGDIKSYFALRAVGDSMNKAGIQDGDIALFKSQPTAVSGKDIVVALIDDLATIKRYKKKNDMVILEPQSTNTNHQPIFLREDFRIQGVFVRTMSV